MELRNIVEALIFASDSPLRPAQLMEIFQHEDFFGMKFDEEKLETALGGLVEKYQSPDFVFELRQIDGGYQFYTKREYYPYVRHAALQRNRKRLSRASLETLSIIAYRQPITKAEVEFIRGVSCDYAIRKLLDKQLIDITGRSDAPGRPLIYGTSRFFMEYFGINDIKDLPKVEEISIDEAAFKDQFKQYQLSEEEAEALAVLKNEEE